MQLSARSGQPEPQEIKIIRGIPQGKSEVRMVWFTMASDVVGAGQQHAVRNGGSRGAGRKEKLNVYLEHLQKHADQNLIFEFQLRPPTFNLPTLPTSIF